MRPRRPEVDVPPLAMRRALKLAELDGLPRLSLERLAAGVGLTPEELRRRAATCGLTPEAHRDAALASADGK